MTAGSNPVDFQRWLFYAASFGLLWGLFSAFALGRSAGGAFISARLGAASSRPSLFDASDVACGGLPVNAQKRNLRERSGMSPDDRARTAVTCPSHYHRRAGPTGVVSRFKTLARSGGCRHAPRRAPPSAEGASDDARLFPLFIGYPNLVRGYDVNTFDAADCTPTSTSDCPAFDRLVGSRLLVGNLEFRFPLLRPFGASQRMYGPLPVEVALFADGGVAWNRSEKPSFLGGSREGVGSAGLTLRVNLFGFAVGSFDFAHPFQRTGKGWVFQFNLSPGF